MFAIRTGWQFWSGLVGAGAAFLMFLSSSFGGAVWALGWVSFATGLSRLIRRNSPKTWFGSSTRGGAALLIVSGLAVGILGISLMPPSSKAVPASIGTPIRPLTSVASSASLSEPSSPEPSHTTADTPTPSTSESVPTPDPANVSSLPAQPSVTAQTTLAAPNPPVTTTAPKPATKAATTEAAPPAPKTTAPAAVYYANCTAARAAGAAPLYRGISPGYRTGLDRDNDGIACE